MNKEKAKSRRKMPTHAIVFLVLFGLFFAICVAALISIAMNGRITVSRYTVGHMGASELGGSEESAQSDAGEDETGVRIVLISDLHRRKFDETNQQLVDRVSEQSPDLICVDGDMLEKSCTAEEVEDFASLLERLQQIAQVYCAYGNHDYEAYSKPVPHGDVGDIWDMDESMLNVLTVRQRLEQTGAIFLEEEYRDIVVNGIDIRIGGMYGYAFLGDDESVNEARKRLTFLAEYCDTDSYKILMCHRPDSFIFNSAADDWEIDLVMSGHTHNGVINIPFVGAIITHDQGLFPKYSKGKFDIGNITLVITGGLDGASNVPRIFNPPEISVIDITE
ncbi:MAG: metallophosphoesterase [Christensenellaceae bacterium]|nr:metallophosphoesterase [Christensenellaceae bacterium]